MRTLGTRGLVVVGWVCLLAVAPVGWAAPAKPNPVATTPALDLADVPPPPSHTSRWLYVGAGAAALAGGAFTWVSLRENAHCQSLTAANAIDASQRSGQASWASSMLLYSTAGALALYGLVLEFLPQPLADKADLTFHF